MNDPIGRAIALRGCLAQRYMRDLTAVPGAEHAHRRWRNDVWPQPITEAEIDQHASGIGRELDAGAGFLKPLGLFENDDTEAAARERQRRRQSADAGANDNDNARRHDVAKLR